MEEVRITVRYGKDGVEVVSYGRNISIHEEGTDDYKLHVIDHTLKRVKADLLQFMFPHKILKEDTE